MIDIKLYLINIFNFDDNQYYHFLCPVYICHNTLQYATVILITILLLYDWSIFRKKYIYYLCNDLNLYFLRYKIFNVFYYNYFNIFYYNFIFTEYILYYIYDRKYDRIIFLILKIIFLMRITNYYWPMMYLYVLIVFDVFHIYKNNNVRITWSKFYIWFININ